MTFSGRVLSTAGKPVAQATIEVGKVMALTDSRGFFRLTVESPPTKPGRRLVLNIRKEGYGLLSRVYGAGTENSSFTLTEATAMRIDPTQTNVIRDIRQSVVCSGTLSSQVDWPAYEGRRQPRRIDAQGAYVGEASSAVKSAMLFAENARDCNEGLTLAVPANALADRQGAPPAGRVTITVSTVDIYSPSSMPGDYGVSLAEGTGYMLTYGAGTITATTPGGRSYQPRKGAAATLTIPVNRSQLAHAKPPATAPLLLYDEVRGLWRQAGEARFDPKQAAYVAEVDHFSAFNIDLIKTDQACVRVDSSDIADDYDLEVTVPSETGAIIRSHAIDNTPEKIHVVYNLPSNTDIGLRALRSQGPVVVPVSDTVSVNTGAPQVPSTPNEPAYPYDICSGRATIFERSLAPVLRGPAASAGPFVLHWDYVWAGLQSTSDGFILEESATSSTTGFTSIYSTANQNDHRTSVDQTITKTVSGTYRYRVRAKTAMGYSPDSNVVEVLVDTAGTTPSPTTLRLKNDLYGVGDWDSWNGLIRVRIASTCAAAIGGTGERLYPYESTTDVANLERVAPGGETRDFDVSTVQPAADGSYCIFIQAGWWDYFCLGSCAWTKHDTKVLDCNGAASVYKSAAIQITPPYFDPELIRASDWLPQLSTWQGHPSCGP